MGGMLYMHVYKELIQPDHLKTRGTGPVRKVKLGVISSHSSCIQL